jgi:hypothetical protein
MSPDNPFQFSRYTPRDLEIIDTTLREGSQTSLLHDHYKYFFSRADKMVAVSFARIFYRNAINNGLPAIVCPEAVAAIEAGQRVTIDLGVGEIRCPVGVFAFERFPLSVQEILTDGGLFPHLQKSRLGL